MHSKTHEVIILNQHLYCYMKVQESIALKSVMVDM